MQQRVLVCGGRDYSDVGQLFDVLDTAHAANPIVDVIHGNASGADSLAHEWAYRRRIRMRPFTADWKKHGKAAGPIRNQRMLDEGRPDMVIAFPGGRGTADMIERANKAGVPVVIVKEKSDGPSKEG